MRLTILAIALSSAFAAPAILQPRQAPRAAFKLPPEEAWRTRTAFPTLPVYANRIPLTPQSFTFPMRMDLAPVLQVRDHASAPLSSQSHGKILVNMPPSFSSRLFTVDQNLPLMSIKNTIPSAPSKKVLINMPPPPRFLPQPLITRTPLPRPIVTSKVIKQFRSQDESGAYHFNYSGGPTSRSETRDPNGAVRGSYSFVDPEGRRRRYSYVADDEGYRVKEEEDQRPVIVAAGPTLFQRLSPTGGKA